MNSSITFLSQTTSIRWLTSLLGSQTVIVTALLFWTCFFLQTLVISTVDISLLWEILIMLLFQFLLTFLQTQNVMLLFNVQLLIIHLLIGDCLGYHLRDVPCPELWLPNFLIGSRLQLIYVSLTVDIRSSLIDLDDFHLPALLPLLVTEITSFVFTNKTDYFCPKQSSGRLVIVVKGFLKLGNQLYGNKTKESITFQNYGYSDFGNVITMYSTRVNLLESNRLMMGHLW